MIAHNASFDFGFLQAAGIDFHRPTQDTFELASILLPGMASYSLGELCRGQDISLPDAHRALDDAEATGHLFCRLLQRLKTLPSAVVQTVLTCGADVDWPPLALLAEHFERLAIPSSSAPSAPLFALNAAKAGQSENVSESLLLDQSPVLYEVDSEIIASIFASDGALSRQMGDAFEIRAGQIDMAMSVRNALNTGDHLLIEAGTGTGKSLAYLLPAALWSIRNQRRVVVATNTIALQDQLLDKDLPQVQALLVECGFSRPRAALLKGRSNYLCTRRFHSWYRSRRLSPLELRVLARILIWMWQTETGDVSELFLPTIAERVIWAKICSDSATCSAERCTTQISSDREALGPYYQDFFLRARRMAETAHILVVNHALLLADIMAGGRVLPPYTHLIVDEAHRFEEAATEQLTYRVDWRKAALLLARLRSTGGSIFAHFPYSRRPERPRLPAQVDKTKCYRPACGLISSGIRRGLA